MEVIQREIDGTPEVKAEPIEARTVVPRIECEENEPPSHEEITQVTAETTTEDALEPLTDEQQNLLSRLNEILASENKP